MDRKDSFARLRRRIVGVSAGLAAFFLVALLSFPRVGFLPRLENLAGDVLRRELAEPLDSRIVLAKLDDESLRLAQSEFAMAWPWSRDAHAQAIEFLRQAGARAVLFDMLFTSPYDGDPELAEKSKSFGAVFAAFESSAAAQPTVLARIANYPRLYDVPIGEGREIVPELHGMDAPMPPLWGAFAGIGDVQFIADDDGFGRRARLAVRIDGQIYPSLAFSAYWTSEGRPPVRFQRDRIEIGPRTFISSSLPSQLDLLFRRVPPQSSWTPLFDLASSGASDAAGRSRVDPARFKGKYVLIGATAPGLHDLRSNPLDKESPGLVLHATLLDNLLTGRSLRIVRIDASLWTLLLFVSIGVSMLSFRKAGRTAILLPFALTAILFALAVALYVRRDTLIPIATPFTMVWAAAGAGALEHFLRERRRRSVIEGAFGQVLSPSLVQQLLIDERPLRTGGEKYELSLFFSDLQGFTSFSEKLSPEQLVDLLNYYLTEMSDVLVESGGYVDKYVGDAIMAFWGAPVPNERHAVSACRAAWRCQVRLARIQPELVARGLEAGPEGMVMRIGLNTGEAVVGMMGSERKLNYTAMGDTVNLASRLEGTNKSYGSRIIVSDATRQAAGDEIQTRELDLIRVKGKSEPTRIFELVGVEDEDPGTIPAGLLTVWTEALRQYRARRFAEARASFERCLELRAGDGASLLYIGRCRDYEIAPPPSDWDGVYTMKTK